MNNVSDFLKRAAEKTGFDRERYIEKNIPDSFENIVVILFYGDVRSEFILATMLLNRIKELHPNKYFILCSYPGRSGLYPYVDEFWGLKDEQSVRLLLDKSIGFDNLAKDRILFQEQQLNRHFESVLSLEDYKKYYFNGFTKEFFDKFQWIVYNLPTIPSSKIEFNRNISQKSGYKIFIHPCKTMRSWQQGHEVVVKSRIDFWHDLTQKLIDSGFAPVIYRDYGSFDISEKFENRLIYCSEEKVLDVMAAMRTTGCVLDVFSGISRWANCARTPFVACAERRRFNLVKDWEIDSLCNSFPYSYIFSFPTLIESGNWNELVSGIVHKLEDFIPTLNRDSFPPTAERSLVLPYDMVKRRKQKKVGLKFIKVDRE